MHGPFLKSILGYQLSDDITESYERVPRDVLPNSNFWNRKFYGIYGSSFVFCIFTKLVKTSEEDRGQCMEFAIDADCMLTFSIT